MMLWVGTIMRCYLGMFRNGSEYWNIQETYHWPTFVHRCMDYPKMQNVSRSLLKQMVVVLMVYWKRLPNRTNQNQQVVCYSHQHRSFVPIIGQHSKSAKPRWKIYLLLIKVGMKMKMQGSVHHLKMTPWLQIGMMTMIWVEEGMQPVLRQQLMMTWILVMTLMVVIGVTMIWMTWEILAVVARSTRTTWKTLPKSILLAEHNSPLLAVHQLLAGSPTVLTHRTTLPLVRLHLVCSCYIDKLQPATFRFSKRI